MAQVARGPLNVLLQSAGGQYLTLGLGVYALFPEQVQRALAPLLGHPALSSTFGDKQGYSQQPIVIQTPPTTIYQTSGHSKSWTTILIYSAAGAGACWVGYIVCSQLLPDAVSEFMPVTKRLYKQTSETLGKAVVEVRELLQEQIAFVLGKQDELAKRQEETHATLKDVQGDLSDARNDLGQLQSSLDRCEAGLHESNQMQGYTLRGIKLLVRCVTSFLPDESNFIEDISRYIEDESGSETNQPGNSNPRPPATRSRSLPARSSAPPQNKQITMGVPNITSIDSEESEEEDDFDSLHHSNSHGSNYMGDIRALLGH
eukprot:CAMPEP_0176067484 /NCGR_PEP_ID=MMETSP0120_2-20121206/33685_1 /TAXON_ID=160619 /ORGANISM="Kryptoperidinium foliaceum, Strain CCMP 1326" /LENGTH=315 /DNA_ID=CAMNT_0017401103 /DNA_START=69 /DNA_END=1016 /DNA_ORIENTATION=-